LGGIDPLGGGPDIMATVTRRVIVPTTLYGVTYEEYVKLRDNPRHDGLRMTYHDGVLELMSPEYRHEGGAYRIDVVIRAVTAVFETPYLGAGSTTFRKGRVRERRGKGKEPDQSYYFANLAAIRGKDTIDLETDPPPDLWIEVDNRVSSRGRLPLYAGLGVPEVWQYRVRRGTLWFGRLVGDRYEATDRSLSLPMLTPAVVLDLLAKAVEAPDDGTWDRQMREWLRDVLKPSFEAENA
jgi:Uma2 family endonuclease